MCSVPGISLVSRRGPSVWFLKYPAVRAFCGREFSSTPAQSSTSPTCDSILPFSLDSNAARETFEKYQRRRSLLSPQGLWNINQPQAKLREVYLPFYAFDCTFSVQVSGEFAAQPGKKRQGDAGGNSNSEENETIETNGMRTYAEGEDVMQVYGSYKYPRHLAKAAIVGSRIQEKTALDKQSIVQSDPELDPLSMSAAVARQLMLRAVHAVELAKAQERFGDKARNVRVQLKAMDESYQTVYLPVFILDYGYGKKSIEHGTQAGKHVVDMWQAAVGGVTGNVVCEPHVSSTKAQVLTAGACGAGVALEMALDPAINILFSTEMVFGSGIMSLSAGLAAKTYEALCRAEQTSKHQESHEQMVEGWVTAWSTRGKRVWVEPELLRQREDSEWRRWENQDKDSWDEHKQAAWAEEIVLQQEQRREEALNWEAEQEMLLRRMQEQESRFKAKREKYGSSFGQSSGQGGALRSGKSPLDYLGYYKLLGLQDKVGEASEDEIKIAFRKVAMTLHPDVQQHKNPKERELIHARFVQLKDAYETLKDPEKRASYLDRRRY